MKKTRKKTVKKKSPPGKKNLTPEQLFLRAFLAFQAEAPELPRTEKVGENGHSYSYTPLPLMRKLLQPLLTKHGFVYAWDFKDVNGKVECSCILTHIDGHSKRATITADKDNTADMNSVQAVGSTSTYLQRYSFKAVLGLTSADEDDDGRSSGKKKKERETIPGPKPKPDGEHNKVVQEILIFENKNGDKQDDSPKK
jgi:hypothetical protein